MVVITIILSIICYILFWYITGKFMGNITVTHWILNTIFCIPFGPLIIIYLGWSKLHE